ncbi:hypothetical protein [Gordonia sp. SND2]|uniref:hypothetical protein n=1 Tax=Gordonia sp. SND2 TaxID=3388659 RepID=UPI00398B3FA9
MTFPTFDTDHPDRGVDGDATRHVQHEIAIPMRIDETDSFVRVPLRSVYVDDGLTGWKFEIGPYSVEGAAARTLANSLAHFGALSGHFRPAGGHA